MKPDEHDWLAEKWGDDPHLPDAGFTARVLERIPERRGFARFLTMRNAILGAFGLLASGVYIVLAGESAGDAIRFAADHLPEAGNWIMGLAAHPQFLVAAWSAAIGITIGFAFLAERSEA